MISQRLFTSESVSEGHPDKVADQLSDAIVDAALRDDADSRVACEALVKTGMVMVAGEMTTNTYIDVEAIARQVIRDIGYCDGIEGFDAQTCAVITAIGKQSSDIAQGVDRRTKAAQGAGDQGLMFGYANNETSAFMPAPIYFAHKLMQQQAHVRKTQQLPWLLPDAKAQLTFRYANNQPIAIESIVLSTQHRPTVEQATIEEAVREEVIKPVLPAHFITADTKYFINPTGRFVIGGPMGDCGLTGRKIIVDTYGGFARHGGGCFSGKDPSKVDRSAAYMARYIAKHIIALGLAASCEIQLAYSIGVAEPVSVAVNTFGTGLVSDEEIVTLIRNHFDMTPFGITETLNLLQPIYQQTAAYGHFGRDDLHLPWEQTDKLPTLQRDPIVQNAQSRLVVPTADSVVDT